MISTGRGKIGFSLCNNYVCLGLSSEFDVMLWASFYVHVKIEPESNFSRMIVWVPVNNNMSDLYTEIDQVIHMPSVGHYSEVKPASFSEVLYFDSESQYSLWIKDQTLNQTLN